MKITKLDRRYKANHKWGYQYIVTFPSWDWRKYFEFKKKTDDMLGPSLSIDGRFYFKDQTDKLNTNAWAYKYTRSSESTYVYFRSEDAMNQVIMMYALTATE